MSRTLLLAVALAVLGGCGRDFVAPNGVPSLDRIDVVEDGSDGTVIEQTDGVPLLRGTLHVRAVPGPGEPVATVEFFTPGRLPDSSGGLTWDTDTSDIFPTGGVLTVTATPISAAGVRGLPKQISFIVDNAAPTVKLLVPQEGQVLHPRDPVEICVVDRKRDNPITVTLQTLDPTTFAPLGSPVMTELTNIDPRPCAMGDLARVYEGIPEIAANVTEDTVQVVATDEVGNSYGYRFNLSFTRVIADIQTNFTFEEDVGSSPWVDPVVPPPQPYDGGLVLTAVVGSSNAAEWLHLDGTSRVATGSLTGQALGIPGAGGLAVFWDEASGGGVNYAMLRDARLLSNLGEANPVDWSGPAPFLFSASTAGVCLAPGALGGSVSTLDCFDRDGGHAAHAFSDVQNGWSADSLTVVGQRVWVSSEDPNGGSARIERFTLPGLDPDPPPDAGLTTVDTCYANDARGAACEADNHSLAIRIDAATGEVARLDPDGGLDCSGYDSQRCLAVTPRGVIVANEDMFNLRTDFYEYFADGSAPIHWGCFPDAPRDSSILAAFSNEGRLYVAARVPGQDTIEVLAYSAPDQLAWHWTTAFPTAGYSDFKLALDDASPQAPLWLMLGDQGEAFALSRGEPPQPDPTVTCP